MKAFRINGITLLTIILLNCCSDLKPESSLSGKLSIKPVGIDLNGVTGFAIVDNTPVTRTEGEQTTTAPQSIYSIDENGNVKLSIFYFEVHTSEDESGNITQIQIQKEISDALQVVPSLVTDLEKYILFSGCQYQINDSILSEEALLICKRFIIENTKPNMVYIIRKSDGALFDLSNQSIFTYSYMEPIDEFSGTYYYWFSPYYVEYNALNQYIPTYRYMISPKGNLFAQSCCDDHIYQFVDNGDAIDLKQLTQDYDVNTLPRFIVDKNENIYLYYVLGAFSRNIDIYFSDGGFDSIDITSDCHLFFDMKVDDNGGAYMFYLVNYGLGPYIKARILSDGKYVESSGIILPGYTHNPYDTYGGDPVIYPHYIGFSNGDFKWFLPQEFWEDYYNDDGTTNTFKTITYNTNRDEWILKDLPKDLDDLLTKKYDSLLCGIKSYGVNVDGNFIEVSEIDIENESSRQYTFNIDLSFIKSQRYITTTLNGLPYLIINGKSSYSGANISLKINLINGENNSTFAPDGRNVVSFFRIN